MKLIKHWAVLFALVLSTLGCANVTNSAENILAGATHAKGVLHVEGYLTDTQGEIEVCKQPEGSTYCEDDND